MPLGAARCGLLGAATVQPYAQSVAGLGPVAYYQLSEPSGLILSDSQGLVDGTVSGVLEYGVPTIAPRDPGGRCLGFDGASARGSIPYAAAHKTAAGGVAVLAQLDHTDHKQIVVASDVAGRDGGWSVEILAGGQPRAYLWDGTSLMELLGAPGSVVAGVACHLALTWGPGGLRLYLDGAEVGSHAGTAGADQDTTSETTIGAWHDGSTGFDGLLGHLVMFADQPDDAAVWSLAGARGVSKANDIDAGSVLVNQTKTIDIRSGGHFKGALTAVIESQGSLGTALPAGATIEYTAGAIPGSDDQFVYRATDDRGPVDPATVTIDVASQPASDDAVPWGFISPQDAPYNATGDGVADDTTALQSFFDAIDDTTFPWLPPDKTYRITDTVTITLQTDTTLYLASKILYDGPNDRPALDIGGGVNLRMGDYRIRSVVNANQSDFSNIACVGVRIGKNLSECMIQIEHVEGFTVGVEGVAASAFFAMYSWLGLGLVKNCQRGLRWHSESGSSAWFNENHIFGGLIRVDPGLNPTQPRYGIEHKVSSGNEHDGNNTFIGTAFDLHPEGTSGEVVLFNSPDWSTNYTHLFGIANYADLSAAGDYILRVDSKPSTFIGSGWYNNFWFAYYAGAEPSSADIDEVTSNPLGNGVITPQALFGAGPSNLTAMGGFLV